MSTCFKVEIWCTACTALSASDLVELSVYDMYLSTACKAMINSKLRMDLVSDSASITDHSEELFAMCSKDGIMLSSVSMKS